LRPLEELRGKLKMSRPELAEFMASRGRKVSASSLEKYEAELPEELGELFAQVARERGWESTALRLEREAGVEQVTGIGDSNVKISSELTREDRGIDSTTPGDIASVVGDGYTEATISKLSDILSSARLPGHVLPLVVEAFRASVVMAVAAVRTPTQDESRKEDDKPIIFEPLQDIPSLQGDTGAAGRTRRERRKAG
jgi:hypothetical protein